MPDLEKQTLSIKTVATIIVLVIAWVGTICGIYFPMAARVDDANKTANAAMALLNQYDLKLIDSEIQEIKSDLHDVDKKSDDILFAINHADSSRPRGGRH
jgi:hypothetical protein